MRMFFYGEMCNGQILRQQKRENKVSVSLILEIIIIIIITLFTGQFL